MARARNIKPGIMANENLAELAPVDRLLFIYLWMLADREGRLEDRPKRIKAEALPYDDVDTNEALNSLAKAGFILRYQAEGQSIIQVVNFTKHQAPHMREQGSSLPAYVPVTTEIEPCPFEVVAEHNLGSAEAMPSPSDSLIPDSGFSDSLIPDSGPGAEASSASKRSAKFDPLSVCPSNVTPEVWAEWVQCRKEQGKPLKETTCAAQAKQLAGHPNADEVVRRSIAGGYQGLFPDRVANNVHHLPSRHHGFDKRDYTAGLIEREDGTYGF